MDSCFGIRFLQAFWGQSPWMVALEFLLIGVSLILAAGKSLGSIPLRRGRRSINVGFFHSWNWSVTFVVLVPWLAYELACFFQGIGPALKDLSVTGVVRPRGTNSSQYELPVLMMRVLTTNEVTIVGVLLAASVALNVYDFRSY